MRALRRIVVAFCHARAESAARRALRARFASCVALAEIARGVELDVSRLRVEAERDERSAREWRDLARQVEAL